MHNNGMEQPQAVRPAFLPQLQLSKYLLTAAKAHFNPNDPLASGLAISLAQDALKLLDYAEESLEEGTKLFFAIDFASVTLADLIRSDSIRHEIKEAELRLSNGEPKLCVNHCGRADFLICQPLENVLPEIGTFDLTVGRHLFDREKANKIDKVFEEIRQQMNSLRIISLAALLKLEPKNFVLYETIMPMRDMMADGTIGIFHKRSDYSMEEANFCLDYVTDLGIKVQQFLDQSLL